MEPESDSDSEMDFTQRSRRRSPRLSKLKEKQVQSAHSESEPQVGRETGQISKSTNSQGRKAEKEEGGATRQAPTTTWKELMDKAIADRDRRVQQCKEPVERVRLPPFKSCLTQDDDSEIDEDAHSTAQTDEQQHMQ